jgi:hypothetical protein
MITHTSNPKIRTIQEEGVEITLDLSTQVLKLEIPEDLGLSETGEHIEAEVYPTLKQVWEYANFAPMAVFIAKSKQFDDGLYAAVEYLCQTGTDRFVGKRELLQQITSVLKKFEQEETTHKKSLSFCQGFINAAAQLGGQTIGVTKEVEMLSKNILTAFFSDLKQSFKPVGIYTWTKDLIEIFQQDRLLQKPLLSEKVIRILARVISENKQIINEYQSYLTFIQKLTNPFSPEYCDLTLIHEVQQDKEYCVFPPSKTYEMEPFKALYGNRSVPEGFSLIEALVQKIQQGKIDLTPKDDSGWYAHQVYALEPLVKPVQSPEAEKLDFDNSYKKELIALFKAAIAFIRETHVKQLENPEFGGLLPEELLQSILIQPNISVEPVATYYLRRADAYRFVRELLESTFGQAALKQAYRLTASGTVSTPLFEELQNMESLFYGTYLIVAEEIGMDSDVRFRERDQHLNEADKAFAREWLRMAPRDADAETDNRMMVPVFYDIERKETKVWVFLGYAVKQLSISFTQEPQLLNIINAQGNPVEATILFSGEQKPLIYPVSAEVYVDKLLDRNEFQALCDRYKTPSAIVNALKRL